MGDFLDLLGSLLDEIRRQAQREIHKRDQVEARLRAHLEQITNMQIGGTQPMEKMLASLIESMREVAQSALDGREIKP